MRNARSLLSGKAVGGVLSLAYLAIAARGLGPESMGALVLAHAYAMTIAGIARFQSWQAVIRFGAPMIRDGDEAAFKRLLRYTIRLDLISGAASILVALALAPVAVTLFGWPQSTRGLITLYCFATPFLIAATPTGVLRLFDRFGLLGWQLALMPVIRFIGAIVLWLAGAGLDAFLAVWIVSALAHGASLWALGLVELKQRNLLPRLTGKSSAPADRAWLPFMIKTNLSSSVDLMSDNAPLLLVGGVLGGAAAGFFKIAFNLANLLAQPVNMFNQATYPELSKIESSQGRGAMRAVTIRSIAAAMAFAAPIVIAYFLFRRSLAQLVGGESFLPAAPLIALMAFAQLFRIAALGLESATLALGRAGWALAGQIAGAIVHLAFLAFALTAIGVVAAPIGIIIGWSTLIVVLIAALFRK